MATNLNYNVNVNATNGIQALNNLQTRVGGLTGAFGKLQTAIGGLALGAAISNAVNFADRIKDLSDSTGIAVANIVGFGQALQNFGGNSEVAEKGILRLVTNIGAAADGSAELQFAFGRVGVSLQDLATLSEQDILAKVIAGLGNVSSTSDQALLKSQLLGKEFRNIAISGSALSDMYQQQSASAVANAEAITRASDAYDRFEKAVNAFKLGLLAAISPLTDFIAKLDAQQVEQFAEAFGRLLIVLAGIIAYVKGIAALTTVVAGLGLAAGSASAGFFALGLGLAAVFAKIALFLVALQAINSVIKFAFGVDPIKELIDWSNKAFNSVKQFLGFKGSDENTKALDKQSEAAKKNAEANAAAGETVRQVTDPYKNLREQISGVADEYSRLNRLNIATINQQTALIGGSREESELVRIRTDLLTKEADEIRKLTDQRGRLNKEQIQAGVGAEIDAEIAKIRERTAADLAGAESAVKASQERTRAFDLERFARQSNIDVERDLRRIQDDIAKTTMGEMERKQYDILAAARERANVEIAAEQARRGSLLTDQEKLKFYEAAKQGTDELIAKEQQLYAESRSFSTGWKQAFQEYTDNATNAAQAAQRIFQKTTQGMEDMIVNFAKTGKFEFKGFINSILEELLRSQVRQLMAQVFNIGGGGGRTAGGGSGLFGSIGNLLGFANGGIIPTNDPVIVGERGPEILSGVAGRVVTPNEALGGSTNVVYNISAVDARSFKELVASDPSFIYAVTEQGRRTIPSTRR
jgi:lambda family phage tail tape measure protein